MLYKTTNKLFRGIYQYKIVLICAGASKFRNGDMDHTLKLLRAVDFNAYTVASNSIKRQDQLDYAINLAKAINGLSDVEVRVESPWVSIYTNSKKDIDLLSKLNPNNVKYISQPPDGMSIQEGTIVLPKVDFEYKITLGRTRHENTAFIDWADSNSTKVKLTRACKRELAKNRSFGGTHFYLSGEKVLLVAKMHLGDSISKIERIIKK